jgi:SnoaL-like domain
MAAETPPHAALAELLAKEAIREALYRELDAWRRRDWVAARESYAAGARADLGFDAERTAEAQLERLAHSLRGAAASTLLASNCLIELGPGSARSTALVLAAHEPRAQAGERTRLEALRLVDAWALGADGGWRIESRRLESVWRAWLDPRLDDHAGDHRHARDWER